jgi:poly(3-hydroxybutyrate) depolymerase
MDGTMNGRAWEGDMRKIRAGMVRTRFVVAALGMLAATACGREAATTAEDARLAPRPIDPASVTVSGPSAGGYMAGQFHVAYSDLVRGAAIIAAGPYRCAEGSLRHGLGRCMKGDEEIPTARLLEETSQLALDGAIDPIAGLADDRVWIFHGAADPFVGVAVADALETYYRALVTPDAVVRVEHPQAGHTFPTADPTAPACTAVEEPYIGNCGLDGARALLGHLYGDLADGRAPRAAGLIEFDQRPYAEAAGSAGLADRGWLFVPPDCEVGADSRCRLHVVFHGCKQGGSYIGDAFIRRSGFLEAAEANRIVLLFPQIEPSFQPLNPNGCWDWWGYEGGDYATRNGVQLRAVRAMIDDLLGGGPGAP